VEVRWRSLFRITSLGKWCTSYNAPPTSLKRAADRWSLQNLPRSSLFMVEKVQTSHRARSGLYGGYSNGLPPIHFFPSRTQNSIQISPHAISRLFQPRKWSSEARNFEVINGLQHVFGKWVERWRNALLVEGGTLKKRPSPQFHKIPTRINKVESTNFSNDPRI
jgi:hypothetical protein